MFVWVEDDLVYRLLMNLLLCSLDSYKFYTSIHMEQNIGCHVSTL